MFRKLFVFVNSVFLITAVFSQDPFHDKLVYQSPEMTKVKIREKVAFAKVNDTTLTFDIYYPPDFTYKSNLPLVIFNNGVGSMDIPRWGQYTNWCRLIATNGMIAVTHQARGNNALKDCEALIDYLSKHSKELNIDAGRIGLWTCSANARTGMRLAFKTRPDLIKALVVYYGGPDSLGQLRQDLPTLIVRPGLDAQFMNMGIDNFIQLSLMQDIRLETINYVNGIHAFDLFTNTDESRSVVIRTVDFLKKNLASPVTQKEFVLTNRNFMWLIMNNQLPNAINEFRKAREKYRADTTFQPFFNGVIREDILNANAYWLLDHQRQPDAVEVFKLAVESYPESPNAYESLSEAYELTNNKAEAIRNAEICLQKIPAATNMNEDFKQRVKQGAEERVRRLK